MAFLKFIEITQSAWQAAVSALPGAPLEPNTLYMVMSGATLPAGAKQVVGTVPGVTGVDCWLSNSSGSGAIPFGTDQVQVGNLIAVNQDTNPVDNLTPALPG